MASNSDTGPEYFADKDMHHPEKKKPFVKPASFTTPPQGGQQQPHGQGGQQQPHGQGGQQDPHGQGEQQQHQPNHGDARQGGEQHQQQQGPQPQGQQQQHGNDNQVILAAMLEMQRQLQLAQQQTAAQNRELQILRERQERQEQLHAHQHHHHEADEAENELIRLMNEASIMPAPRAPARPRTIMCQEQSVIRPYNTEHGRIAQEVQRELMDKIMMKESFTDSLRTMLGRRTTRAQLSFDEQRRFDNLTTNVKKISQEIADLNHRQQQLVNAQYKDTRILEMPIYERAPLTYKRHHMTMSGTNLKDNVGIFNPEYKDSDIFRVWKALHKYGMKHYFAEDEYIEALQKVVAGEAATQLDNMITSNYSLEKILKFWVGIYGGKQSLQNERTQLQNFTRAKGEPLLVAMLRATVIIDRLHVQHDRLSWPAIRNVFLRETLFRIITPQVAKYLQAMEETHEHDGYRVTTDELQNTADYFERSQDKAPKSAWPPATTADIYQHLMHDDMSAMPMAVTVPVNQTSWNQQKVQKMDTEGYGFVQQPQPQQQPMPYNRGRPDSREYNNEYGGNNRKRSYDQSKATDRMSTQSQSPNRYQSSQSSQPRGQSRERAYQPQQQRSYSRDRYPPRTQSPNYRASQSSQPRSYSGDRGQRNQSYDRRGRSPSYDRSRNDYRSNNNNNNNNRSSYDQQRSQSYERRQRDDRQRQDQRQRDERREPSPARPNNNNNNRSNEDIPPTDLPKQDINIITGHNNAYYKCNSSRCVKQYHAFDASYHSQKKENPKNGDFSCPDKLNY